MSDALLTRIAQMESELATLRGRKSDQPTFDKRAFLLDPAGYMARNMGLTPDEQLHVNRVNLAVAMGDHAPQELKYLATQGPQIAQTSALTASLDELRRQVQELIGSKSEEATVTSLKALIADKEKYPHFSKAITNDPTLIERAKGRKGTAEEIAKSLEDEAAVFAKAYGVAAQPASDNAVNKEAQSTQSKPAPLAGGIGNAPPLPTPKGGPITPEEDEAIKAELDRKYGRAKR